jgi:hypothetical protein
MVNPSGVSATNVELGPSDANTPSGLQPCVIGEFDGPQLAASVAPHGDVTP